MILYLQKENYGRTNMNNAQLQSQDNINTDEEIIDYNQEIQKAFNKLLENPKLQFLMKNEETYSLLLVGALVNDTIYKQQKFFQTSGILKKITPLLNYISLERTKNMLNMCEKLQRSIAFKKHIKMTFLYKLVTKKVSQICDKLQENQFQLSLGFITGYNLYSEAISEVFFKNESKKGFQEQINDVKKITSLNNYTNNNGYKFGLIFGLYFFSIQYNQSKKFRTLNLLKKQIPFIRRPDWKNTIRLLHEINSVNIKLLSTREIERRDGVVIPKTFLLGSHLQLELIKYIDSYQDYHAYDILNGFGTALIYYRDFNKLLLTEDPFEITPTQLTKEKQKTSKEKIFVSEEDLITKYHETSLISSHEKLAYLMGIMLNILNYLENKKFNTSRLIHKFVILFRRLTFENINKLHSEIYYTYIILWNQNETIIARNRGEKQYSLKYYRILSKTLQLLGTLPNKSDLSETTLALIQGYEARKEIYITMKKQTDI